MPIFLDMLSRYTLKGADNAARQLAFRLLFVMMQTKRNNFREIKDAVKRRH